MINPLMCIPFTGLTESLATNLTIVQFWKLLLLKMDKLLMSTLVAGSTERLVTELTLEGLLLKMNGFFVSDSSRVVFKHFVAVLTLVSIFFYRKVNGLFVPGFNREESKRLVAKLTLIKVLVIMNSLLMHIPVGTSSKSLVTVLTFERSYLEMYSVLMLVQFTIVP